MKFPNKSKEDISKGIPGGSTEGIHGAISKDIQGSYFLRLSLRNFGESSEELLGITIQGLIAGIPAGHSCIIKVIQAGIPPSQWFQQVFLQKFLQGFLLLFFHLLPKKYNQHLL